MPGLLERTAALRGQLAESIIRFGSGEVDGQLSIGFSAMLPCLKRFSNVNTDSWKFSDIIGDSGWLLYTEGVGLIDQSNGRTQEAA